MPKWSFTFTATGISSNMQLFFPLRAFCSLGAYSVITCEICKRNVLELCASRRVRLKQEQSVDDGMVHHIQSNTIQDYKTYSTSSRCTLNGGHGLSVMESTVVVIMPCLFKVRWAVARGCLISASYVFRRIWRSEKDGSTNMGFSWFRSERGPGMWYRCIIFSKFHGKRNILAKRYIKVALLQKRQYTCSVLFVRYDVSL